MNQTANYQLSQWEATDRILMSDFNSDNAKIDAALKDHDTALAGKAGAADVAALESSVAALQSKAGLQHIATLTIPGGGTEATVGLADVDWGSWKAVHLVAYLPGERGQSVGVYLNGEEDSYLGGTSGSGTILVSLWPMYHPELPVTGFSNSEPFPAAASAYSDITHLLVQIGVGADRPLPSGGKIEVYGEK